MKASVSLYLPSIRRLALDTAPLIYYIEKNSDYIDNMKKIMQYISDSANIIAIASVIALKEVLVNPLKLGKTTLAEEYKDILTNNAYLQLEDVTPEIAHKAAELRAKYGRWFKPLDSVHVATAIVSKCDLFLTNDLALKKIDEIQVICLSEVMIITHDDTTFL